jgi:hypothetical protein
MYATSFPAAIALVVALTGTPLAAQSSAPVEVVTETAYRLDTAPDSPATEVPVETASRISIAAREAHDAAIEYAEAIVSGNWTRAAAAMHPDALAEIKASVRRKAKGDPARWPLSLMPGARTIEAFDAMPPEQVFVRVMRLIDAARPEETAGISGIEFRELEVESDSEAVVKVDLLNQDDHGEIDRSRAKIILRRFGEGWRAMPESDLKRVRRFHR